MRLIDADELQKSIRERLQHTREEQEEDCIKHDGYWTEEQGERKGAMKAYLEIINIIHSATIWNGGEGLVKKSRKETS